MRLAMSLFLINNFLVFSFWVFEAYAGYMNPGDGVIIVKLIGSWFDDKSCWYEDLTP